MQHLIATALLLATTSTAAVAETVTYDYALDITATAYDATTGGIAANNTPTFNIVMDAFDTGLGSLNFAQITVNAQFSMYWEIEDSGSGASGTTRGSTTAAFGGTTIASVTRSFSLSCVASVFSSPTCPQSDRLTAKTVGTRTWSAASWDTAYGANNRLYGNLWATSNLSSGAYVRTSLDSNYIGNVFSSLDNAFWTATLTYDYTPSQVPLPAAGGLLLAGLGGMAAVRRRRTKTSG